MQRKLGILFIIAVILSFFAGFYATKIVPSLSVNTPDSAYTFVTNFLKENYPYDIDETVAHEAYIASLEAMIHSYANANNDPYTRLVKTPTDASPSSDESFVGLGIRFVFEQNHLWIHQILEGSPLTGLALPNDLIIGVEVNDQKIYFKDLESQNQVLSYLKGTVDTNQTIILLTPDQVELSISFTYQTILTPTVETIDLNENQIGYIKINAFSGKSDFTVGTNVLFDQILRELQNTKLMNTPETKTLILDLRDNPGGALSALHSGDLNQLGIVELLLPRNTDQVLFSLESNSGTDLYYGRSQTKPYNIKVLVNNRSASAAEVLAAALTTAGGYQLYGDQTYGKGVFQNDAYLFQANNIRYSLTYTQGKWYYGNQLNVESHPLVVELITQNGIKTLDLPLYNGRLYQDLVSTDLINYQKFFNYYYQLQPNEQLRTDGYFDQKTYDTIVLFQMENSLLVSGELNREVAIKVDELFRLHHNDIEKDIQLQSLIELIKTS